MAATVKGGSYNFQQASVGGYWSWTIDSNNTFGVGQQYQISNINTPYGPLIAVSIPIPGDIVIAMSDSLLDVQSQLAPLMALVQPAITVFPITITEGDPDIVVGSVPFQNIGAYGSFMSVSATPDSVWLTGAPSSFQGIGKNVSDSVVISLLTSTIVFASTPYSGVINLQDNHNPATVIPITIAVTVLPRPTILASPTSIPLNYILSTATSSSPQVLTIKNSGPVGSILNYSVAKVNGYGWLAITPGTGGPLGSGISTTETISVVPSKVPLIPGTYTETLHISSINASNSPVKITVSISVT